MLEEFGVVDVILPVLLGVELTLGVHEGVGGVAEGVIRDSASHVDGPGDLEGVVVLGRGPSELFGLPLVIFIETDDLQDEILPHLHFLPHQRPLFQIRKI